MHCKAYISMEQAHSHTPREREKKKKHVQIHQMNTNMRNIAYKNSQRIFAALRSICAKNVIVLMRLSF